MGAVKGFPNGSAYVCVQQISNFGSYNVLAGRIEKK